MQSVVGVTIGVSTIILSDLIGYQDLILIEWKHHGSLDNGMNWRNI